MLGPHGQMRRAFPGGFTKKLEDPQTYMTPLSENHLFSRGGRLANALDLGTENLTAKQGLSLGVLTSEHSGSEYLSQDRYPNEQVVLQDRYGFPFQSSHADSLCA